MPSLGNTPTSFLKLYTLNSYWSNTEKVGVGYYAPVAYHTQFLNQNRMLIVCVPINKFPHIPYRKWIQNNKFHKYSIFITQIMPLIKD
jgi:hypothetical protein